MDIETAKRNAANRAVADHFPDSANYIGIGSGTTIVYVLEAIVALHRDTHSIRFVPTGYESRQNIIKYGLTPIAFDSLPPNVLLDVAFDGADEVDEDLNCIKGGGACLYQEKLVATHARKFVCVADHRKLQPRLLTHWPSIPIEVDPLAASVVLSALRALGSHAPSLRTGPMSKAGPLKTDQANFIIDAPFPTLVLPRDLPLKSSRRSRPMMPAKAPSKQNPDVTPVAEADRRGNATADDSHAVDGEDDLPGKQGLKGEADATVSAVWEVEALAKEIKLIEGVLSVGIFCGENGPQALEAGKKMGGQKPVAAYFGMADGGVVVRRAGEGERTVVEGESR